LIFCKDDGIKFKQSGLSTGSALLCFELFYQSTFEHICRSYICIICMLEFLALLGYAEFHTFLHVTACCLVLADSSNAAKLYEGITSCKERKYTSGEMFVYLCTCQQISHKNCSARIIC